MILTPFLFRSRRRRAARREPLVRVTWVMTTGEDCEIPAADPGELGISVPDEVLAAAGRRRVLVTLPEVLLSWVSAEKLAYGDFRIVTGDLALSEAELVAAALCGP